MRKERDSLGEKEVPDEAWYGVHTVRSLENFHVMGERVPLEIVYGMVKLKWACAKTNRTLGLLSSEKAEAISKACRRILAGGFESQFAIDVFQAGSGTSSNMNVNEVVANVACEELGAARGDRDRRGAPTAPMRRRRAVGRPIRRAPGARRPGKTPAPPAYGPHPRP